MIGQLSRRAFAQCLAASLAACSTGSNVLGSEFLSKDETPMDLVKANNSLAFVLLKRLVETKPSDNQFFSPFSLESALLIALHGARRQTAIEMARVLQLPQALQVASGEPDLARLSHDYQALTKRLQPPSEASVSGLRKEVAELKQQLAEANQQAQQLTKAGKHTESSKFAKQATALANRVNQISKTIDPFELSSANSLWVDRSYPLAEDFTRKVTQNFGTSSANSCDFQKSADAERVRINDWVATQTHDKVRDIIPAGGLSRETRLVIANAIYFKGNWARPFEASRTASAEFTDESQKKTQVSMMFAPALKEARYAAFESNGTAFETPEMVGEGAGGGPGKIPSEGTLYPDDAGYQVLELPYVGEQLSMMIVLPRKADGLNKLVASMTAEQFEKIREQLKARPVHVKLPKFKLEANYNLIPDLKALGMQDAFSPQAADFSGLTDSLSPDARLYISLVIHKAFVEVNEQGTEAAAATVVGMARLAAPLRRPFIPDFTVDHPFLFSIIDNQTNNILFLGKVNSCPS